MRRLLGVESTWLPSLRSSRSSRVEVVDAVVVAAVDVTTAVAIIADVVVLVPTVVKSRHLVIIAKVWESGCAIIHVCGCLRLVYVLLRVLCLPLAASCT